jgi:hypothetical protein
LIRFNNIPAEGKGAPNMLLEKAGRCMGDGGGTVGGSYIQM